MCQWEKLSVVVAPRKKINNKLVRTIQRGIHAMIDFLIFGEIT